ncbi:MAG: serine protease [Chitinophagaceae bacterium]
MSEIQLLDAVERYIRGEMTPDERLYFEQLRKTNPEVDQLVVEQTLFLQQINRYGEWRKFKHLLSEVHTDLAEQGKINSQKLKGKTRRIYLWKRYRRVVTIAASIASITAISISALVWSISPKPDMEKIQNLSKELHDVKIATSRTQNDVNKLKDQINSTQVPDNFIAKSGGTGFLIDGSGLMITNAHVVRNSKNIRVVNSRGNVFNAFVVKLDVPRDIAIIKIDDSQFKQVSSLPYSFRKSPSDLAEPIFTLGFPRDSVVYGEGYLSATSGYNGDTLSCQIAIPANPGNSGGPVFNHNGEVIGVLSAKETQTEGAVFAVQAKYIYQVLDEIRKDSLYKNVKIPSKTSIAGLPKTQQVKKIQDFVFMVKGD